MIFNKKLLRNVSQLERSLSCAQLGIQLRFQKGRTCRDVGVAERLDVPDLRLSLHRCIILLGETDLPRKKDRERCTRDLDVGGPTLQIEVAVTLEVEARDQETEVVAATLEVDARDQETEVVAVILEVEARDREILQLVSVIIALMEVEGKEGSRAG